MVKSSYLVLFSLLFIFNSFGQNYPDQVAYNVKKAQGEIIIDGELNEADWLTAERGGGFFQTFPTDNKLAEDSTQFMITYTEEFVYVGVICYDYLPGRPITNTLKRDFSWMRNDNVSFYVDPFNDKSNGFTFQVTYDNVQREGIVVLGGEVQGDWDNKWYSEVGRGENFWTVEMAIPFKSFRYNSIPEWNVQFLRNNQKRNERSCWIQVPQQFRMSDMVYTGRMVWDVPPPEAGTNVSFIPYVAGGASRNFENRPTKASELDAGFDAKIGVSNSLNLDLTFNPDFSQVEVDRQVTNLQRFEISFPERRQFFLENQDLFAQNGFPESRPFFSRRIGIQGQGSTQRNVPIIGGARLSGKIGSKWRMGVLNMVSDEDETLNNENSSANIAPAQNYSVAVLERQIFKRSRVSATFVGRTNLGQAALDSFRVFNNTVLDQFGNQIAAKDTLYTLSEYNYVYGLDYNLATINNRWTGNFYYHRSIDPDRKDNNYSHGGYLQYAKTNYSIEIYQASVGEGYNADVGFVPRKGITNFGTSMNYNFFREGLIQRHGPRLRIGNVLDTNLNLLDRSISSSYEVRFLSSAQLEIGYNWESILLQSGFDPSGSDGLELAEGEVYNSSRGYISYNSDSRKNFSYDFFVGTGPYFNGTRTATGGSLTLRSQPILQITIGAEYNKIDLPAPYSDANLLLINPRIDLTLTNKVFFTSFLQYNTQARNFSQNHRFQWRFKPVSDLFIVYSDNYITTPNFEARNRALVFKLSYWFNL